MHSIRIDNFAQVDSVALEVMHGAKVPGYAPVPGGWLSGMKRWRKKRRHSLLPELNPGAHDRALNLWRRIASGEISEPGTVAAIRRDNATWFARFAKKSTDVTARTNDQAHL